MQRMIQHKCWLCLEPAMNTIVSINDDETSGLMEAQPLVDLAMTTTGPLCLTHVSKHTFTPQGVG